MLSISELMTQLQIMKYILSLFCLTCVLTLNAQNQKVEAEPVDASLIDSVAASEANMKAAREDLVQLSEWLDKYDSQLKAQTPPSKDMSTMKSANLNLSKSNLRSMGAPISTSRSNIKQLQAALDNLETSDPANRKAKLNEVQKALADLETPIQELHNSILAMGEKYAGKAAELKISHDTVKNSIGNIR